ncbi:MAG: type ribosomal protection protein [Candidatus Parcubacteria bacterium]|jgi:macrolide transport system ATP-binding/permease protein
MLSLKNLSIGFGATELLKDVSFKVSKGERMGLIGENGSGKSTLLKVLAGIMESESGRIDMKGTVGYLAQEPVVIGADEMSGGEKSREALKKALGSDATEHNLYLLDEPTNNLDIDALEWLERLIQNSPASFIIVSHDRKFLDNTVTKIIEIDSFTKSIVSYGGNYTYFREKKQQERENELNARAQYEKKVSDLSDSIKQKKVWARTGSTETVRTDTEKMGAGIQMDRSTHIFSIAKNLERRLAKVHEEAPIDRHIVKALDFEFLPTERSGTVVFEAKAVVKCFANKTITIGPINTHLEYGDKLAITGKNGAGKSTFIEMLAGTITPDSGTIARAKNLSFGYLRQKPLIETQTVLESMPNSTREEITRTRHLLSRFGFTENQVAKPISILSPGERSRLVLAQLVVTGPNCIILDEPSNHLDIEALEALENAIRSFSGTVIVISHDRYFLERIQPNKTLEIKRA